MVERGKVALLKSPSTEARTGLRYEEGKYSGPPGIEPQRGPVLSRDPGLVCQGTVNSIGSLAMVDHVRVW